MVNTKKIALKMPVVTRSLIVRLFFAGLIWLLMLILLFCNALTLWDRYAILWLDMANRYI